jgi:hypothetical protein
MSFREFFKNCTFRLYATGDSSWDLYIMEYQGQKGLVALAKPDTGASDCYYGKMNYLDQLERKGINHGFTIIKTT